jgi:hypothetical protein
MKLTHSLERDLIVKHLVTFGSLFFRYDLFIGVLETCCPLLDFGFGSVNERKSSRRKRVDERSIDRRNELPQARATKELVSLSIRRVSKLL